jgi:hypothetical protein
MNKLISSIKKWILGIFMVSLTSMLSGEILEALSEEDACLFLENACNSAQYLEQVPVLFVDIDKTIIRESSDFRSYETISGFGYMKPINLRVAQKIRELYESENIKSVGLTSVKGWNIVGNLENRFDILPTRIAHSRSIKWKNCGKFEIIEKSPYRRFVPKPWQFWTFPLRLHLGQEL